MASGPPQTPAEEPTTSQPASPVPAPSEKQPLAPGLDELVPAPPNSPAGEPVWRAP
jgi:hypothetical protein